MACITGVGDTIHRYQALNIISEALPTRYHQQMTLMTPSLVVKRSNEHRHGRSNTHHGGREGDRG